MAFTKLPKQQRLPLDIPKLDDDPSLKMDIMGRSRQEEILPGCFWALGPGGLAPRVTKNTSGPSYLLD